MPLIIRYPPAVAAGRVVDKNVSTCDIFATLCELTGLEIPAGLDSRSLCGLMSPTAVDGSGWELNEAVSQFGGQGTQITPEMGFTNVMIKHDDLKYQYYGPSVPEVLFDLGSDAAEERDCIDEPEYAEAVERFRARLAELGHGPGARPGYTGAGYVGNPRAAAPRL